MSSIALRKRTIHQDHGIYFALELLMEKYWVTVCLLLVCAVGRTSVSDDDIKTKGAKVEYAQTNLTAALARIQDYRPPRKLFGASVAGDYGYTMICSEVIAAGRALAGFDEFVPAFYESKTLSQQETNALEFFKNPKLEDSAIDSCSTVKIMKKFASDLETHLRMLSQSMSPSTPSNGASNP